MRYRRVGRSELLLPAACSACGRTSAATGRSRPSRRSCAAPSTSASPSTWPTATATPYGSAKENIGRILATDLRGHRDELVISTKAGYDMWPGPYGDHGSRAHHRPASTRAASARCCPVMNIFYSRRVDGHCWRRRWGLGCPNPPGQGAVRRHLSPLSGADPGGGGDPARPGHALLIHQPSYSMLNRWIEDVQTVLGERVSCIVFSPLAQGMLTNRYLGGIPEGSRASHTPAPSTPPSSTRRPWPRSGAQRARRPARPGMARMAVAWTTPRPAVTLGPARRLQRRGSGASGAWAGSTGDDELAEIDRYATDEAGISLWAASSEV